MGVGERGSGSRRPEGGSSEASWERLKINVWQDDETLEDKTMKESLRESKLGCTNEVLVSKKK